MLNRAYYYKNPDMAIKANLGKDRDAAVRLAHSLNQKYRTQIEQQAAIVEASLDLGGPCFEIEFNTQGLARRHDASVEPDGDAGRRSRRISSRVQISASRT